MDASAISDHPLTSATSSDTAKRYPKSRSSSFSASPSPSSSPSSSSSSSFSSFSPISSLRLSGVPFKWERQPGIPKQTGSPKPAGPTPDLLLPLPPAGLLASSRRLVPVWKTKESDGSVRRDPFLAALVACSKAEESGKGSRVMGLGDLYGSCKSSCSVIGSTVAISRSGRSGYDVLHRRFG